VRRRAVAHVFVALVVLALLVALSTPGVQAQGPGAQAQRPGVLQGQVLNASSGQAAVAGAAVTLWALDAQQPQMVQQQMTGGQGQYRFEGLDTQGVSYQLQVDFQGASYWSEVPAFPQGESTLSLPVRVYESTSSDADLWVEQAHLILGFEPGVLWVQEVQIVANAGVKTYIPSGQGGTTVRFALPDGASNLQLMEGMMECCAVLTDHGFAYTRPIYPGQREFFYSYQLPYRTSHYQFSRHILYPTRHLDVLIPDSGVNVTGPGLTVEDTLSFENRTDLHLSAEDLAPGSDLILNLDNLPLGSPPAQPTTSAPSILWSMVMGLGTMLVLLLLVYPFLKARRGGAS
jgi:5-hydroxyisourate hydrolase-like protein (transthyretin family)